MNADIDRAIAACYELEGLLLLAKQKQESLSPELLELISQKQDVVDDCIYEWVTHRSMDRINNKEEETDVERDEANPYTEIAPEEVISKENNLITDENFDIANEEACHEDYEVSTGEPVTAEEVMTSNNVPETVSESVPVDEPEVMAEDMEDIPVDDIADYDETSSERESIRLDEALARENSRNIRQAFTLNDKFRFRRELFGNSDTEFTDTLNLVSAMSSLAEAQDYFYGDLEWNPENEEVKAFMDIISAHFKSRES